MPRLKPNAKVVITLKGLGFGHYFDEEKLWEFVFLRGIEKHCLIITINAYFKGYTNPLSKRFPIPNETRHIEVKTNKPKPPSVYRHISNDFEWRQSVDDFHDARWIPDFSEELYGKPLNLKIKPPKEETQEETQNETCTIKKPKFGLTLLSVKDAVFYTHQQTDRFQRYQILKDEQEFKERVMGQVGGLDIEWDGNQGNYSELIIDGKATPLPNRDDLILYELVIDNDCPDAQGESDFHLYHCHLIDEDFHSEILSEQLKPGMVGKTDCHISVAENIAFKSGFSGLSMENKSLQLLME